MEDLQSILPQHAIGNNIRWWIGQVEKKDTKYSNRFKVRIVGRHLKGSSDQGIPGVTTDNLPWCHTMLPVTTPYSDGGATGATANLEIGNWVMGFFLDEDAQRPIIVGSIGHVSNATTEAPKKHDNSEGEKNLTVVADNNTNPNTMQPADSSVSPNLAGHPPGVDEKSTSALIARLNSENSETNPGGIKFCVNVADPNCGGEKDMGGQIETIIGEMLKANQDAGGQLGDYLVSKATGQLYNYVGGARKYINKIFQVVKTFIARIKGEIVKKIKEGIDKLVKALLKPDSFLGDSLKTVREFVNKLLENLGCSMADIASRLQNWLTNLLFDYLYQVFKQAACQVDQLVNGILNEITSLLDGVLGKILGPLSSILGAVAAPLNLIGGAINSIFRLLGISCDGPNQKCVKTTKVCVDCGSEKKKDFLDDLLDKLSDGPLEGNYICSDANSPIGPKSTNLTFVGGSYKYKYKPETGGSSTSASSTDLVVYNVSPSYKTKEGKLATFTVTRSGSLDKSSSITYKTINGSAKSGSDYFSAQGTLGFAPGQTQKTFTVQILNDNVDEPVEEFYIKFKVATGIYDAYFDSTSSNTQLTTVYILQDSNSGDGKTGTQPVDVNIPSATDDEDDDDDDDTYQPKKKNPEDETNNPSFPDGDLPTDPDDTTETNTDPTYSVTADKNKVGEGGVITYTIATTNVEDGTILSYTLSGATTQDDITSSDILNGVMNGSFVIDSGTSTVQVTVAEDNDDSELEETLRFTIDNTTAFADVIIDPLLTEDDDGVEKTYSVVSNKTVVAEGDSVIYTIITTNVDDGTILSYTLSGSDITSADIVGGQLKGTFVIDSNTATVVVSIAEDATAESSETLKFAIDDTNASVNVVIDPASTSTTPDDDGGGDDSDGGDEETPVTDEDGDGDGEETQPDAPYLNHVINLSVNKSVVKEGEFVTYTIRTQNVDKGTKFGYTLFGENITTEDVLGGSLVGTFTIEQVDLDTKVNPTGSDSFLIKTITIGIAEDGLIEDDEVLIFALNGTGKQVSVLIDVADIGDTNNPSDPGDGDGVGGGGNKGGGVITYPDPNPQPEKPGDGDDVNDPSDPLSPDPKSPGYEVVIDNPPFKEPKPGKPVVDEDGVIIELPILDGGGPYVEAPTVLISGQGYGAAAIALLDDRGAVSELRITNPGRGYIGDVASKITSSCVIDSYTMIRPGQGYTEKPQVFVDGKEGIAEAVIADGRVISLRVLERTAVFESYPTVSIIGGNGFGALFIPSFVCLDILELERNEYAKIGTGKYIDCP